MQGMSLLIVSVEIQIQKPHLRWPPQNPSLYNPLFIYFFPLILMMFMGLFGCQENLGKRKKIMVFYFVLCLFTQFYLFYFILFYKFIYGFLHLD